jgi:CARDB
VEHRSTVRRSRRRRPPSRSSLLVGLVVVLLATVPVLVPLLVTRDGDVSAAVPPGLAAGVPALPRAGDGAEPAGTTTAATAGAGAVAPVPAAGTLAGTTAPATPPATAAPRVPRTTRPGAPPSSPAGTSPAGAPPPGTLMAAPDLVVVAVAWSPERPRAGEAVTFTAVVRNAGTDATPEVTHGVGFAVNGSPTTWSSAGSAPLAPGEERTYTADGGPAGPTWTAVAGEHELRAYVDDVDRIGETDDGNNVMTATLTVA